MVQLLQSNKNSKLDPKNIQLQFVPNSHNTLDLARNFYPKVTKLESEANSFKFHLNQTLDRRQLYPQSFSHKKGQKLIFNGFRG